MTEQNTEVVRHLPYLRRYARALLGSQARGDRYVRVCLETLLEEPDRLADSPPRLGLYRLFHEVHDRFSVTLDRGSERPREADALEMGIQGLPPQQRQVLLLTALEGFSIEEAAQVLSLDGNKAEALLRAARKELQDQASAEVLVIEDEPVIAVDIAGIVTEMGHKVVGTATTKDEAVEMATELRPGIVLADIKLGDGSSGVDAANEILEAIDVPVVFVTAYPECLLTGQQREPTYLVTKPFEPDVLKVTINQALFSRKPVASADADQ